ncbi:MAG TPA: enolase C-terminal domain-like protein [Acidimicrobiales bacterium]|nr:enolase C-terminal domain-like protein [Acidimicrobiales bacterium]
MPSNIDVPITSLSASTYVIPTDGPEADGTFAWDSTTMVVVEARAGDQTGTGWTYAPRAAAVVIEDTLTDIVIGRDAGAITAIYEEACRAVRNQGRGGIAACAISAVDLALWDLLARLHDEPLHRFLGRVHRDVAVYGSGGFTTYDDRRLDEQLTYWVDTEGFSSVKIKIGESWGANVTRDLARMRQVRGRIGPDRELFVDGNGAYGVSQAIGVLMRCEDAAVSWFEEPVSSDDLEGLRSVRHAVTADVAAGEYGWDLWTLRRLCSSGAVDCLQADATRCGGITGWRRAATIAAAYGLEISGHTSPHAHAHVASATVNVRHLEWFHDHARIEERFFDGSLSPSGGRVNPDDERIGNGYTFRSSDAAHFLVQ